MTSSYNNTNNDHGGNDHNTQNEGHTVDTTVISNTSIACPPLAKSRNEGVVPDFIQKLFNMLESTDATSCYHWGRHGTTFVIEDTNEFAKTVLPRRFKHGNFSSFVRQLNKYDFHKIRSTDSKLSSPTHQQAWEFQHRLFRRDRKHLLCQIHRKANHHKQQQQQQQQQHIEQSHRTAKLPSTQKNDTEKSSAAISAVSESSAALQHLHDMQMSLQAQINKLGDGQKSMESTLQQLMATDTLLLEELSTLKRGLSDRDSLLETKFGTSKRLHPSTQSETYHNPPSSHSGSEMALGDMPVPSSPQSPSLKLYPWLHPTSNTAGTAYHSSSFQLPNILNTSNDSSAHGSYCFAGTELTINKGLPSPQQQQQQQHHHHQQYQQPIASPSYHARSTDTALPTTPSIQQSSSMSSPPLQLAPPSSSPPSSSSPSVCSEVSSSSIGPQLSSTTTSPVASSLVSPSTVQSEKTPEREPTCLDWRHQPKVLVVEDNVMYRRISMRCLQRLGCDFDLACDGLEAVTCMKTSKYDLILMDISIPKLDGMAATRKLRQYDQHTPVVSMTSSYSNNDIVNYVGSGMSDLLPKPFDQRKLYDILKEHCKHLQ